MKAAITKIQEYAFYWVVCTLILPIQVSNIGLAVFIITSLVTFRPGELRTVASNHKMATWAGVLMIGFFIYHLIYFIPDISASNYRIFERSLPYLFLPLLLLFQRHKWISKSGIGYLYIISLSLLVLILILNNVIHYISSGSFLFFHNFSELYRIHAVYVAYNIFIAGLIIMWFFKTTGQSKIRLLLTVSSLILFTGLLFCASKNVTVIGLIFWVIYAVWIRLIDFKRTALILGVLAMLGMIVANTDSKLKDRLTELGSLSGKESLQRIEEGHKLTNNEMRALNGTTLRLIIWKFGKEIISEHDALWTGVSPYHSKEPLLKKYEQHGMKAWFGGYGFHNQFITFTVEFGLIGLLLFTAILILQGIYYLKTHNRMAVIFLLAMVLFQMSESILERNKGLVLYLLFSILFLKINYSEDETGHTGN